MGTPEPLHLVSRHLATLNGEVALGALGVLVAGAHSQGVSHPSTERPLFGWQGLAGINFYGQLLDSVAGPAPHIVLFPSAWVARPECRGWPRNSGFRRCGALSTSSRGLGSLAHGLIPPTKRDLLLPSAVHTRDPCWEPGGYRETRCWAGNRKRCCWPRSPPNTPSRKMHLVRERDPPCMTYL